MPDRDSSAVSATGRYARVLLVGQTRLAIPIEANQ